MRKPRPTAMNIQLREALRHLKRMPPADRARLMVKAGVIPPEKEAAAAAYYVAEAAKARAAEAQTAG